VSSRSHIELNICVNTWFQPCSTDHNLFMNNFQTGTLKLFLNFAAGICLSIRMCSLNQPCFLLYASEELKRKEMRDLYMAETIKDAAILITEPNLHIVLSLDTEALVLVYPFKEETAFCTYKDSVRAAL
jgi:hypothetical protein